VGLHAFEVDGVVCLASAYLEEVGEDYRYRYAVLCGGDAAKRALRVAALDPGDSDNPGPARRVAIATYADYDGFLYRLPMYLNDVNRRLESHLRQTEVADDRIRDARGGLRASRRKHETAKRR
jgi:hypothetical protein